MAKRNVMLDRLEARYALEYEIKYQQALKDFETQLHIANQMHLDASLIAADEVFGTNANTALEFARAHIEAINEMSGLMAEDGKDDRDLEYARHTIDERLKKICGSNFVPWNDQYIRRER